MRVSIYGLFDGDDCRYIGATIDPRSRAQSHASTPGRSEFSFRVLDEARSQEAAANLEQDYIAQYRRGGHQLLNDEMYRGYSPGGSKLCRAARACAPQCSVRIHIEPIAPGRRKRQQKFSGRRLRAIRKERKIAMQNLAAGLTILRDRGMSPKTIQNYELGRTKPAFDDVYLLAELLGVSVLHLTEDVQ